ncbi:MAG: hypothetical protein KAR32_05660, partial [Candidatus Omnitrophica bacterium]|nr:hypothetical protein [Candidatus Omnitrophota bacterium]
SRSLLSKKEGLKVIFLDIDGVLVTDISRFIAEKWLGKKTPEENLVESLDPEAIANLKEIIQKTGAKIVISSTHRARGVFENMGKVYELIHKEKTDAGVDIAPLCREKNINFLQEVWRIGKLPGEIIDITPIIIPVKNDKKLIPWLLKRRRGYEIYLWLKEHKVLRYVIFDDTEEMLEPQSENFIKCESHLGITEKNAAEAIKILNSPKVKGAKKQKSSSSPVGIKSRPDTNAANLKCSSPAFSKYKGISSGSLAVSDWPDILRDDLKTLKDKIRALSSEQVISGGYPELSVRWKDLVAPNPISRSKYSSIWKYRLAGTNEFYVTRDAVSNCMIADLIMGRFLRVLGIRTTQSHLISERGYKSEKLILMPFIQGNNLEEELLRGVIDNNCADFVQSMELIDLAFNNWDRKEVHVIIGRDGIPVFIDGDVSLGIDEKSEGVNFKNRVRSGWKSEYSFSNIFYGNSLYFSLSKRTRAKVWMARRFVLIPDKHIEATVEFFVDQFEESNFDKGRCITELKQAKRDALIFISRPSSVSSPIKDSIVSLLSGKTEQGLNHKTAHSDRLVKRREFLRIGFGYMTKLSGLGALLFLAEGCAGSARGRGSKALR